jgi:biopolymer transport protein ExbB
MNQHESLSVLDQLLHTWSTGGWVMIALAGLGLIMYTTAAHLLLSLYHRGLKKASDSDIRDWIVDPDRAPARIREFIRYSQDEVKSLRDIEGRFREIEALKVPEADRRLSSLGVMVVAAPLFGLLGTVLGMLLTFKAIGVGGSSVSEVVAKGISEALVATQTGLTVALPGWMAAFLAKRWRAEYASFLARLESITLRHFRPRFHGMTRVFTRADFAAKKPTSAPVHP